MENIVRKRAERRGLQLVKSRQRNMHAFWLYRRASGELLEGGDTGCSLDEIARCIEFNDAIDQLIADGAIEVVPS
jgi:hypothetical protein